MERLAQNTTYTMEHTGIDENGDKILTVYEPHSNAEIPFTPVLSRKQKQQVKKNLQIGKPPPYKTRSEGGSNSSLH